MIGARRTNPYLFRRGGEITGDYEFTEQVDITFEEGCMLRSVDHPDCQLTFRNARTEVDGDVAVNGKLIAGSMTSDVEFLGDLHVTGSVYGHNLIPNPSILPSDPSFNSVYVTTTVTTNTVRTNALQLPTGGALLSSDGTTTTLHQDVSVSTGKKITVDKIEISAIDAQGSWIDLNGNVKVQAGKELQADWVNTDELMVAKIKPTLMSSDLTFSDYECIDFSDIDITGTGGDGWPEGGAGVQFPLNANGNAYDVDKSIDCVGHVEGLSLHATGGSVLCHGILPVNPTVTSTLTFELFTTIDFGDIDIVGTGGSGWGGLPQNPAGDAYELDKSLNSAGHVSGTYLNASGGEILCSDIGPQTGSNGTLHFLQFTTIDFHGIDVVNWNGPTSGGSAAVPTDLSITSLTATSHVETEDVRCASLSLRKGPGGVFSQVMLMDHPEWLRINNMDTSYLDLSGVRIAMDRTVDVNGSPAALSWMDYNPHYQAINVTRMRAGDLLAQDISFRLQNDNDVEGCKVLTLNSDVDKYPYVSVQAKSNGTRFTQERFTIMPKLSSFTLPLPFSTYTGPFNNSTWTGKNCALEVFGVNHYWKDMGYGQQSSFLWPQFQVAADPTLVTGEHMDSLYMTDYPNWDDGVSLFSDRPSHVSINKPPRFLLTTQMMPPQIGHHIAEPDALCIRFGYSDQQTKCGEGFDPVFYNTDNFEAQINSGLVPSQRGISFRKPIYHGPFEVHSIHETLHLGRDFSTIGCALHNCYVNAEEHSDYQTPLLTIAPWDWVAKKASGDTSRFKHDQLVILGTIRCWGGSVAHSINYTLSHHVETDEERVWDDFRGRILSWTGLPGGNDDGTQITGWKHGIYKHALSTVALSSVGEDINFAGVCQGTTAEKDDTEITYSHHINHFVNYHGARQTVEVSDRGDSMVWIVLPLNSEIPINADMLSGTYNKTVNAVATGEQVIINVNNDFSFTVTESIASILTQLAALQAQVDLLVNA